VLSKYKALQTSDGCGVFYCWSDLSITAIASGILWPGKQPEKGPERPENGLNAEFGIAMRLSSAESAGLAKMGMTIFAQLVRRKGIPLRPDQ
jgi:hypothetical protein